MEYVLGIHTAVPARIARRIIRARDRAYFLDGPSKDFAPHVTLYLCRYSRPAFRQLLKNIQGQRFPGAVVHLDHVTVRPDNRDRRIVVIQARRTPALIRLHAAVTAQGNRLRQNLLRKKDILRIRSGVYTTAERNLTVQLGYRGAGRGFSPHVTVSRIIGRPGVAQQLAQRLQTVVGSSWRARRIVIGLYRYNNSSGRYVGQVRERVIRLAEV